MAVRIVRYWISRQFKSGLQAKSKKKSQLTFFVTLFTMRYSVFYNALPDFERKSKDAGSNGSCG